MKYQMLASIIKPDPLADSMRVFLGGFFWGGYANFLFFLMGTLIIKGRLD